MAAEKRVCFIHAYPTEYAIKTAYDLGYKVVLVNPDPNFGKLFHPYLEDQIRVTLSDDQNFYDRIADYHQEKPFSVVPALNEVTVSLVARVARRLGLDGNPVEAADAARDKYLAAMKWKRAGVPAPKTVAMSDPWTGHYLIAEQLGFPAIMANSFFANCHIFP